MASQQTQPKRPRLSLQIKTSCSPATRSSRSYPMDPKDPTALNTLSNVYMTAIERATPVQAEPITAINTLQAFTLVTPVEYEDPKNRVVTPYVTSYPETPLTAHSTSSPQLEMNYPSMTATPPLSAGPIDSNSSKIFTFSSADISVKPAEQATLPPPKNQSLPRLTTPYTLSGLCLQAPYTHPRSLHSILRNSPLPPNTAIPPPSPRRQSRRLQEKANKKVGYNNPLTQEIITNKYTKSHIDLLAEEASPNASPDMQTRPETVLDVALAFTANEIQDGGQTPGPFEDMRRRMAGLVTSSPVSSPTGIRKRKRKEKKRRWVWTIGQDDDGEDVGGAIAALRNVTQEETKTPITAIPTTAIPTITYMEDTPTPSIESADSGSESFDVEMSDTSSLMSEERGLTPCDMDLDLKTPTAPRWPSEAPSIASVASLGGQRDTPIPPELVGEPRKQRDTPVPEEIL
ncbi:Fc.00g014510.m01.CDS01 [Cosmosporella sp. VM-42]